MGTRPAGFAQRNKFPGHTLFGKFYIFKDTCKISWKFVNTRHIKNLRGVFFDNLSRDEKSGVKVEKRTLVAQLKLKMSADA